MGPVVSHQFNYGIQCYLSEDHYFQLKCQKSILLFAVCIYRTELEGDLPSFANMGKRSSEKCLRGIIVALVIFVLACVI